MKKHIGNSILGILYTILAHAAVLFMIEFAGEKVRHGALMLVLLVFAGVYCVLAKKLKGHVTFFVTVLTSNIILFSAEGTVLEFIKHGIIKSEISLYGYWEVCYFIVAALLAVCVTDALLISRDVKNKHIKGLIQGCCFPVLARSVLWGMFVVGEFFLGGKPLLSYIMIFVAIPVALLALAIVCYLLATGEGNALLFFAAAAASHAALFGAEGLLFSFRDDYDFFNGGLGVASMICLMLIGLAAELVIVAIITVVKKAYLKKHNKETKTEGAVLESKYSENTETSNA